METKEVQRWTAKRKVELLLQLIRGKRKLVDVCREHDLKQSEVEAWMITGRNRRPWAARRRCVSIV
jgi:transposase-like protein